MATYGLTGLHVAELKKEETGGLKYGEIKRMTGVMELSETINVAKASIYGDNVIQETVSEFLNATGTAKFTGTDRQTLAFLIGAKYDQGNKTITRKPSDTSPYVGFGAVKCLMQDGVKYYVGVVYSKAMFDLSGTQTVTKGDNIQFEGETLNFTAFAPKTGAEWQVSAEFKTEEEAFEWIKSKLVQEA